MGVELGGWAEGNIFLLLNTFVTLALAGNVACLITSTMVYWISYKLVRLIMFYVAVVTLFSYSLQLLDLFLLIAKGKTLFGDMEDLV